MGSVQSGKTASMLGVAAKSLDHGIDILVILAGTRLSLWSQTYDRLQEQLDIGVDSPTKGRRRILVPPPGAIGAGSGNVPLAALYRVQSAQVRRAVRNRQPLIIVAMKQTDHLRALGKALRDNIFPAIGALDRPAHLLVLDDEADDGSILDAHVERSMDPVFGQLKQIPRAIADLWRPRTAAAPSNLFTTYVGYTATPQANFLQYDQNPLAPRDFVVSLRTPLDRGELVPRSSSYFEPDGLDRFYTGGTVFYERGRDAELCVPTGASPGEDRADAIRAFLVAGAIRVLRKPDRLGPFSAISRTFGSELEVEQSTPDSHSMLVHPSASVGDHFASAIEILRWAGIDSDEEARELIRSGNAYLPLALSDRIEVEEELWEAWVERYQRSARELHRQFVTSVQKTIPSWADIKKALKTEVIPGTRVAVVNSDPNADDRPEYSPRSSGDTWAAPRDLSTIFVSGNVMARGLTLEGLTTTLFLRHSNQPFADSQMQMQRWFGYRGAYIELCRLFASQEQLGFFSAYHDTDEAMRSVITAEMSNGAGAPSPQVLQGHGFLATGKIANLGNQPLCQGGRPLIKLVNSGEEEDQNAITVADLFRARPSSEVIAGGRLRGRMLDAPLSLREAAGLLDQLQFEGYRPGSDNWQGALWNEVQTRVEDQGKLKGGEPLYRPAHPIEGRSADPVRKDCPYTLGAYLRLWEACLTRHVRGLFPTEGPPRQWSLVDLAARIKQQPKFWVGIRFGGGEPVNSGPLGELDFSIPVAERKVVNGQVVGGWGTQSPLAGPDQYRGDDFMDYYFRGEKVTTANREGSVWRPAGSDGQILFYVNQQAGQVHPTVITGVCIPLGGPDQFSASLDLTRS